jgi:hypothetical protein
MVSTKKVTTTKQEREEITEKAVALFNLAFPDYGIEDSIDLYCRKKEHTENELRALCSDDIKLTQVTTKAGHMGIHTSGEYWKLGINMKSWQDFWTTEQKISLLLHELSHMPVGNQNHDPKFWETLATGIQTALQHYNETRNIIGEEFRCDTVRDYAAQSIKNANDVTDVANQTKTFCNAIDYSSKHVDAFSHVNIIIAESAYEKADTTCSIDEITTTETYRDWRLHQVLDRQSPIGYFTGEAVKFVTPFTVETLPSNTDTVVAKHRSGANIALLNRIKNITRQELPDIPLRKR